MERLSISKISGYEVHYTMSLILLVKIMLCSKLHCQKTFKLKVFSYKISDIVGAVVAGDHVLGALAPRARLPQQAQRRRRVRDVF